MRELCPQCQLVSALCLCASTTKLQARTRIVVLQHPQEVNHAKNTLRLARLCLPEIQVWVGERPEDFSDARVQIAQRYSVLCYPQAGSVTLASQATQVEQLVFIDATWRKAYKLLQLNPWLQSLPLCHFSDAPAGDYRLRKTSQAGGLSTLESIAYGLGCVEQLDVQALYQLQTEWVSRRQHFMPAQVRQRYEP